MAGWIPWTFEEWEPAPPEPPPTGPRSYVGMLPGLPGMIVDIRNAEKISRIPETDIAFGTAVLASNNDAYCRSAVDENANSPYEAAGLQFLGIAMRDMTAATGTIDFWKTEYSDHYRKNGWNAAIVCGGRVWVVAQSAVQEGDPVVILSDGTFMTSNDPACFIPRARWVTSAPAGMLAVVELNMPTG